MRGLVGFRLPGWLPRWDLGTGGTAASGQWVRNSVMIRLLLHRPVISYWLSPYK